MFARLVSRKNQSRRRSSRRRSTKHFVGQRSFMGRSSRFEYLEDRWMLSAGDLDPAFGTGGIVTTNFFGSESNFANDVILQSDGKIVAVGASTQPSTAQDFGIVRYNSDGSVDTSFGNGGRVTTVHGGDQTANSVAVDTAGRLVVAGVFHSVPDVGNGLAMARYASNGTLDPSFGSGGKVFLFQSQYWANKVGLDATGRLLIAGASTLLDGTRDFGLARFNSNGTLDTTFATGGIASLSFGNAEDFANDFQIQQDGKIVVVGSARSGSNRDFALARFNSDGTLDTTFGSGGTVLTDFGTDDGANSLIIQASGSLVVGGWSGTDFALAKYDTNGNLDTSFSSDGRVTTDFNGGSDFGSGIIIDTLGRITLAGTSNGDTAVARYLSDGSLDTSFGVSGLRTTDFGSASDDGRGIAIDPSGHMIVAGSTFNSVTLTDFALARYNSDGSLDTTFDGDGRVTTDFLSPKSDLLSDIVLDSITGKIIAVGSTGGAGGSDFALRATTPMERSIRHLAKAVR